jgi:5S rRNA maturation endonuclease (ribonuclease M5)
LEDLLEKIEDALAELKILNRKMPIIVEGESDILALRELDLKGEVIQINVGQPLFTFCEELSRKYKEVIILTDWDRKGGHLCRVLSEDLKANDVKYNIKSRAKLAAYCKKETKDVEGLPGCVRRIKRVIKNGKWR